MISEEESFFSDASESDVGSIFSDGGSSCDEDSFGPNDDSPVAVPCVLPSPITASVAIPSIDSSSQTTVQHGTPKPKPRRDDGSCSTVDEFYSLEPSELTQAIAELSTTEGDEPTVVKPRSKSLNDSIGPNEGAKSPAFRTTRALTNVTNTKDHYGAQRSDIFTARKATTPIRKKIQTLQSKVSQGQLQPAGEPNREMANQNPKWQERKTILKDINNRRKALLNSSWENNTTDNGEYHKIIFQLLMTNLDTGTNVFEMTMAEEDREDQKRRHRLSREKFENLF